MSIRDFFQDPKLSCDCLRWVCVSALFSSLMYTHGWTIHQTWLDLPVSEHPLRYYKSGKCQYFCVNACLCKYDDWSKYSTIMRVQVTWHWGCRCTYAAVWGNLHWAAQHAVFLSHGWGPGLMSSPAASSGKQLLWRQSERRPSYNVSVWPVHSSCIIISTKQRHIIY